MLYWRVYISFTWGTRSTVLDKNSVIILGVNCIRTCKKHDYINLWIVYNIAYKMNNMTKHSFRPHTFHLICIIISGLPYFFNSNSQSRLGQRSSASVANQISNIVQDNKPLTYLLYRRLCNSYFNFMIDIGIQDMISRTVFSPWR